MSIEEIREKTAETEPYFFAEDTMAYFGQTLSSFSVERMRDGRYRISAPMKDHTGKIMGQTVRYYNPATNELDRE